MDPMGRYSPSFSIRSVADFWDPKELVAGLGLKSPKSRTSGSRTCAGSTEGLIQKAAEYICAGN